MKVVVAKNYDEVSRLAADIIVNELQANPCATLGLATGSTPIGCYNLLSDFCRRKQISFAKVKTVNLDEYVGLPSSHKQSYAYFMRRHLFDNVDIELANTAIPNGNSADIEGECVRYSALIKSLPRDIQVLGLGSNGHIGFNEPCTPFDSTTHVVELAQSTVSDNSRLFDDLNDVPRRAITMGISEILQARKVILLACGANKAQAVRDMIKGKITPDCPASALRKHPDCVVIVDESAAVLL